VSAVAPQFTVLLPTHNRSDVVGYAIESVLGQTLPNFELLVLGDGCTDDTAAVVAGFSDPRLRWFDLPKAPLFGYAHRNMAVREARGELIAFIAHDDIWLPDHLELFTPLFTDGTTDWAYSRPVWVADDGTMVPFAVDLLQRDELETFMTDHNTVPAGNVVYRRECHDRVGLYPEDIRFGTDWEMWRRIIGARAGTGIAYLSEITQLHFRATWKTGAKWGPDPLLAWLKAAPAPWWPDALKVPVSEGKPAQAAFAELLRSDGRGSTARWRAAVPRLMDALAWRGAIALDEARSRAQRDSVAAERSSP
jgi:glycosyltransferase involved in cell wall biosynthesis